MILNSPTAEHLMSLVEDGTITQENLLEMCLNWMIDEDLCDMAETNNLPLPDDWYSPLMDEEIEEDWKLDDMVGTI